MILPVFRGGAGGARVRAGGRELDCPRRAYHWGATCKLCAKGNVVPGQMLFSYNEKRRTSVHFVSGIAHFPPEGCWTGTRLAREFRCRGGIQPVQAPARATTAHAQEHPLLQPAEQAGLRPALLGHSEALETISCGIACPYKIPMRFRRYAHDILMMLV